MPYFSIVIPLYNKEKYVANTLRSILSQTFADYEIIIIDDCSTDQSLAVVQGFENERVRIISHNKNKGLSAARNTGIRHAQSQYITFLDADDTWKPLFLKKIAELISKFPEAGIFATGYEEIHSQDLALEVHKNLAFKEGEMAIVPDFFTANSHQPIFCYSCVAIKKEVFENAGYFDESISLGEDVDFNIRANLRYSLAYYNGVCASYTIVSENQITTSDINNKAITDFDKYEQFTADRPSLKKYLDINRYVLAMDYKISGNREKFLELVSGMDRKNLTSRQVVLLHSPVFVIRLARKVKKVLLGKGRRLTTFRS